MRHSLDKMARASQGVLSKYATFSGRASRSEFWWWCLTLILLLILCRIADHLISAPLLGGDIGPDESRLRPISWLFSVALIVPHIAVSARRLHDIGRTGWWLLIGLVPVIGPLLLIYFYLQPSSDDETAFGPRQQLRP
ncbi:MAG: DUF805 domain-containing protein [Pseudomonadota bacterium]